MIVVKLGGSLLTSGNLPSCLKKIQHHYHGKPVILVPGGGSFADQIRLAQQQWHFDDKTAHRMAILAMKQMALLFNALQPEFNLTESLTGFSDWNKIKGISIWSPDVDELDKAGIPASWDITSDSLAAWLAHTLAADELILVKSVKIDTPFDVLKLMQLQIVDASFYKFTQHAAFKLNIVHAENFLS